MGNGKINVTDDQSLESNTSRLTLQTSTCDIEKSNTKYAYQDIILRKFKSTKLTVKDFYQETIRAITSAMDDRFGKYLVRVLDIHTWPRIEEKLAMFGDFEMAQLSQHFNDILLMNGTLLKSTCYLLSRITLKPLILIFGKLFS